MSPYFFPLVIDDLIRHIQVSPWCIFAADIVLIDETRAKINYNLKFWRKGLESKGLDELDLYLKI